MSAVGPKSKVVIVKSEVLNSRCEVRRCFKVCTKFEVEILSEIRSKSVRCLNSVQCSKYYVQSLAEV